jgi:hypothetical protein
MTVAVIDIGTNTVLLLVARVLKTGEIQPLVYEQRVPRLGRGVDSRGTLDPGAMERVITVLKEYRDLMAGCHRDLRDQRGTGRCQRRGIRREDREGDGLQTGGSRRRGGSTLDLPGGSERRPGPGQVHRD